MGYDVVVLGSVQSYVSVLELNFLLAMYTLGCTRVKLSQKVKSVGLKRLGAEKYRTSIGVQKNENYCPCEACR